MIKIYGHGVSIGGTRKGAWASSIFIEKKRKFICGNSRDTTNSRMVMIALLESLKEISYIIEDFPEEKVIFYTRYEFVANALNSYLENWKENDFKKVKNDDIWKQIYPLVKDLDIEGKFLTEETKEIKSFAKTFKHQLRSIK